MKGSTEPQKLFLRGAIAVARAALGRNYMDMQNLCDDYRTHYGLRFSRPAALALRVSSLYCIQHIGRNRYIMLNREYKPIGCGGASFASDAFADYEQFPTHILTGDHLPAIFSQHLDEVYEGEAWFFSNDSNAPWYGDRKRLEEYTKELVDLMNALFPEEE